MKKDKIYIFSKIIIILAFVLIVATIAITVYSLVTFGPDIVNFIKSLLSNYTGG